MVTNCGQSIYSGTTTQENTDHILRCDRGRHCSCEGEGQCCSVDSSPPSVAVCSGMASIPSGPDQTNIRQTHGNSHF